MHRDHLSHSHDPLLVAMAIGLAVLASYTALDLANRIRASRGSARAVWRASAAVAMGSGIWSMHFIAMLAFSLGIPVSYDAEQTVLSLLVAIAVTGVGFHVVTDRAPDQVRLALAGTVMGGGIASMHYIGMAALRLEASLRYDPTLVVLSVLVAIAAAIAALWLAFRANSFAEKLAAAVVMGLAVTGMHYLGMAAAEFTAVADAPRPDALPPGLLAIAVGSSTALILLLTLSASIVDRRFADLAERETARFRALVQNAQDMVALVDAEGRITFLSASAERAFGWRIGDPLDSAFASVVAEARRAPGKVAETLARLPRPDDTTREIEACAVDLPEEPAIAGLVINLRDVTRRRQLEDELRQAQKMEAVGQLTGGIAHDFNNLLTVIRGSLDLIQRRSREEAVLRLVASGLKAAERGQTLTQQLLAFSRKQRLEPEPLDLNQVVRGMSDLLSRTLGATITINTRLAPVLATALADRHQLESALLNLAINARDAMPGGGQLTLTTAEVAYDGRPHVMVAVTDSGSGMTPEVRARAFDPFFTTKEVGKGTGLGLSMVFGFVRQSDGHVALDTAPGRGTTVKLYLPRTAAAPRRERIAPMAPVPVRAGATLLVVEDDEEVRLLAEQTLLDLGFRVLTAPHAQAAEALLATEPSIELLFTDIVMPGAVDGVELARRAVRQRPEIGVLLTSGYTARYRIGPDMAFLAKPYDQAELARRIAGLLPMPAPEARSA